MADLTFENKNNQKKTVSVFASGITSTTATMNETMFTLPAASMILNIFVVTTVASGTATDTVDVKVGSTIVANEVVVGVVGVASGSLTRAYFSTGGVVTVVAGADAPGTAGRFKLVVEYIETELCNGAYTD